MDGAPVSSACQSDSISEAEALRPDAAFWKGKRVFLTGHTGFKGAWLGLWLSHMGAVVRGYALRPETSPSLFERVRLEDQLEHVVGDIRAKGDVAKSLGDFRPDVVMHLAAQAIVRRAHREPVETFETNVQGTVNVLDACRLTPSVKAAVIVTTDKCYENPEWAWPFREIDRLGGHEPYSASKACAELAAAAYRETYFAGQSSCRVATARAGNVIGGGDWSEARLIPDAVRSAVAGGTLSVRNPKSVRPWQHVVEPLLGYLMLAKSLAVHPDGSPTALNFGPSPDQFASVGEVADLFFAKWGGGGWRHDPEPNAPREARLLKLDSSLAAETLGWTSRLTLDEAVGASVRWYQAEAQGATAKELAALAMEQVGQLTPSAARTGR